jgi:hypothetical protein
MACPSCGLSVLFGGIKHNGVKYCSKKCFDSDSTNRFASEIPDGEVESFAREIYAGSCPACNGDGPIDVFKSYFTYSIILYTNYKTKEHVVCVACARKVQRKDMALSALVGWWGFPFGLIITPIILLMNSVALLLNPAQKGPTKALIKQSRYILANKKLRNA